LGPFRAVRWEALDSLGMRDPDYGWTLEMQARAARRAASGGGAGELSAPGRALEDLGHRPGRHRRGWKILFTIARVRLGG